ncbi:MAG: YigZ family protein [Clostridia bacterium]|nr:YigZ family protein [Clostridia bacterium]
MLGNFSTIAEHVEAKITEKKSVFIANVFPITDEEDAMRKLNEIKKKERDARHNVFAYRIANGSERYSDDGEPNGTAGMPILSILRGENLQNVLVVVTRYFGGILLGTGGLMHAYSDATKLAIADAKKKEMVLHSQYEVKMNYELYQTIEYYCRTNNIKIVNSVFLDVVVLEIVVEKENEDNFVKKIEELSNRTANINVVNSGFYA